MGVKLIDLPDGERLADIARVITRQPDEEENDAAASGEEAENGGDPGL